jgi:hypothetical protein
VVHLRLAGNRDPANAAILAFNDPTSCAVDFSDFSHGKIGRFPMMQDEEVGRNYRKR